MMWVLFDWLCGTNVIHDNDHVWITSKSLICTHCLSSVTSWSWMPLAVVFFFCMLEQFSWCAVTRFCTSLNLRFGDPPVEGFLSLEWLCAPLWWWLLTSSRVGVPGATLVKAMWFLSSSILRNPVGWMWRVTRDLEFQPTMMTVVHQSISSSVMRLFPFGLLLVWLIEVSQIHRT